MSSTAFSQYDVTVTLNEHDDGRGLLDVAPLLGLYAGIIALFLMILVLAGKLIRNYDGDEAVEEDRAPNDNRLLLSAEQVVFSSYGTSEENLESGIRRFGASSTDDLYDEKICAICYDDQRTCSFIPCGHCVTCYICAKRIINDEVKSCPICRSIIYEVRNSKIV